MIRKDYQLIARVLNNIWKTTTNSENFLVLRIAEDLAYNLKKDNPKFDYNIFLQAVTKTKNTKKQLIFKI